MNNKKSTLNKLILFILSYSLLFNNIVYASSVITLFNEDIENKLYCNNIEDIEGDLSLESIQDTNEYYA
uniref:hypothetical protein n=1 Tax=uncultured Brachyspira sp. TaxID=221953 RepID=UPI00261950CD